MSAPNLDCVAVHGSRRHLACTWDVHLDAVEPTPSQERRRVDGVRAAALQRGLGYTRYVPHNIIVALVVEEVVVETSGNLRVEALPPLGVLFSIGEHALDRVLEEDVAVVVPPRSL